MKRLILCAFLVLAIAASTFAVEGVKGGVKGRNPSTGLNPTNPNLPALNETAGLCYMRIPYSHWVALNATNTTARAVTPQHTDSRIQPHQPWITIVDCCEGFAHNVTTGNCEPYCEQGCEGGRCTGPNICTCSRGWTSERGICKPVCSRPCRPHAYCFAPEECVCELGYESIANECKPICPGGCVNGDCIAPKVCRCKVGYTLTDQNRCFPTCEGGCPHGDCTAPGVCTCYRGYVNPPGETEACLPHCPNGCSDGECTSPGVCTCRYGFVRDSSGRCVSECRNGCTNGRCVGLNQCECNPGYTYNSQTGQCTRAGGCTNYCTNGICTSDNTCRCNPGYALDPTDRYGSTCMPVCAGGCSNGICSGPNFCICHPGFVKDRSVKGSQRCVRRT